MQPTKNNVLIFMEDVKIEETGDVIHKYILLC